MEHKISPQIRQFNRYSDDDDDDNNNNNNRP
jgi:hypothetical protein